MKNRHKESLLRQKSFMPIFSEKIIKNTLKDRTYFLMWKTATRRAFCDRKVLCTFLAKNHQKHYQGQAFFFNMKNNYKESLLRQKSFMPIFSEKIIKNTLKDRTSYFNMKHRSKERDYGGMVLGIDEKFFMGKKWVYS